MTTFYTSILQDVFRPNPTSKITILTSSETDFTSVIIDFDSVKIDDLIGNTLRWIDITHQEWTVDVFFRLIFESDDIS